MINSKKCIRIFCALSAFSFLGLKVNESQAALENTRPNIVVILCDDLGYGDLASYGHPHIKTPRLDRMAEEGIRFTDFYSTAPVCSSSRVGLLTGRSPNRAGVYDWIPPGRTARPDAREQVHLRKEEVTIPMLLKEAGYATALSGKWHCNAYFNSDKQPQPNDAGFDYWFATHNNAAPSHKNPVNFVRNGEAVGPLEGYSCNLVAEESVRWVETHRKENPEQPFFLFMTFHEPHEPIASPPSLVDGYRDIAETEKQATYYANVENVDRSVGYFEDALKRLKIDEDTLVIFTADNGPETLNRYPNASYSYGVADPLRGMKLWTTEAGFRVAGIVRWPGRIQGNQTLKQVTSALDFLPSFCELAGIEAPRQLELDGTSLLPLFEGETLKREKPLVWAFYNATNERRVAMRSGNWKVLARIDFPKAQNIHDGNVEALKQAELSDFELYDLSKDVGESKDLAKSQPETLQRLSEVLRAEYAALLSDAYVWKRSME